MQVTVFVLRLALALVFLVAGAAKLADPAGSRRALREFGLPAVSAPALGAALPLAELAVGAGLLFAGTARWAAGGALALLLLFTGVIGYNLARGRAPQCHCFGSLHSAPAGRGTLLRNVVLAVMSGIVVWQEWRVTGRGGQGFLGWPGIVDGAQIVVAAAVVLVIAVLFAQGWLLLGLLRQNGQLLLRVEALEAAVGAGREAVDPQRASGLPAGARAPGFELPDLAGGTTSLDMLRAAGHAVVLVFSDPECAPCAQLMPVLERWHRGHGDAFTLAVLSRRSRRPGSAPQEGSVPGFAPVLLQKDREIAEAYQVEGTPSAVLVRPDGTVGSELAAGADAITALLARVADQGRPGTVETITGGDTDAASSSLPTRGDPAPSFTLPGLDGHPVALADFRGLSTLLIFWDPGCGFCGAMLDDLKAREERPAAGTPRLLLVSGGTADANRAMGVRSPVLLDPGFRVGRAFGAHGTPSGLLIDAAGRIASDVATGAPDLIALMDGHRPLKLLHA